MSESSSGLASPLASISVEPGSVEAGSVEAGPVEAGSESASFSKASPLRQQSIFTLLGLCPLLAVSTNVTNGIGLGLATAFVLMFSALWAAAIRQYFSSALRLPFAMLLIGTTVTIADRLLEAFVLPLHQSLGLFVPLMVTNCLILARLESVATRHRVTDALCDAARMSAGFGLTLVALGIFRELLGQGTLFVGISPLVTGLTLGHYTPVFDGISFGGLGSGLVIMSLPAGAFFTLAALIIVGRMLTQHGASR